MKKGLGIISSTQRFALSHSEAIEFAKKMQDVFIDKKDLVIYPLSAGKWPQSISYLFKPSKDIKGTENPFLSVYDTYLMKYSDIVN